MTYNNDIRLVFGTGNATPVSTVMLDTGIKRIIIFVKLLPDITTLLNLRLFFII